MRTSPISGASILSFAALAFALTFGSTASARGSLSLNPARLPQRKGETRNNSRPSRRRKRRKM